MEKPPKLYQAVNLQKGSLLGSRIRLAGTSRERRHGLLRMDSLEDGCGLWIYPCEAIHTFGMRLPIDAIFLDKQYRVRKQSRAIPARRISACLSAQSVLELPAGTIDRSETEVGDILELTESRA